MTDSGSVGSANRGAKEVSDWVLCRKMPSQLVVTRWPRLRLQQRQQMGLLAGKRCVVGLGWTENFALKVRFETLASG